MKQLPCNKTYEMTNEDARDILKQYDALAHQISHRYKYLNGITKEELYLTAQEGILQAANSHDIDKASLCTYAFITAKGHASEFIRKHMHHTKNNVKINDWHDALSCDGFEEELQNSMDIEIILTKLSNSKVGKSKNGTTGDGVRAAEILRKSWIEDKDQVTIAKEYGISSERVRQILNSTMKFLQKEYQTNG